MKLTEWYPAHIKPVRKGVYQTELHKHKAYQYWDGTHWCVSYDTVKTANTSLYNSMSQNVSWRGVAK